MATDYQTQITHLYDELASIQSSLVKLAYLTDVYAIQASLQTQMNSIATRLDTLTTTVETLQQTMNDLIIELRNK